MCKNPGSDILMAITSTWLIAERIRAFRQAPSNRLSQTDSLVFSVIHIRRFTVLIRKRSVTKSVLEFALAYGRPSLCPDTIRSWKHTRI